MFIATAMALFFVKGVSEETINFGWGEVLKIH